MGLMQDVLSSFFPDKADKLAKKSERRANIEPNAEDVIGNETVKRTGKLTQAAHHKRLYGKQPSFVDYLPWGEFLEQEGVMLLDDVRSVGVVFDVKPIGTEGRSEDYLSRVRSLVKDALQDSFDELDNYPYVIQFYCQDEQDLRSYVEKLNTYIRPDIRQSAFTQEWLKNTAKHLKDISKPGGLFVDDRITNTIWSGRIRRTRMIIYRYVGKNEKQSAVESLNNACERVVGALTTAGLHLTRQTGEQIHQWLLRWFNPNPAMSFDLDNGSCYDKLHQPISDDLPFIGQDFSENLFYNQPESKKDYWYFDGFPHEVVVVDNLRNTPTIGHFTGEVRRGKNINALFDLLPESTIMVTTIVVYPQDKLEAHLEKISSRAVGENYESIYLKQDVKTVMEYLKDGHKLYQAGLAFYIHGKDEKELKRRSRELRTILLSNNLVPVKENAEIAPLNSYLRWLPMNFNPQLDMKTHYYTKYYFVQHLANMLPVFGRETGTGHPGITYFNRGGSPLDFDPINPKDRAKNAHKLLLGPTGSGKSATLNAQMAQLMAVHRPRLFVVEAGNSFGLFADYAQRYGLTVNRISLEPSSDIALPLFSEAHKLLEMNVDVEAVIDDEEDEEGSEQRDLLAEMELTTRLMITGGELKEDDKMSRADRAQIRRAIMIAAEKTYAEGRQTLAGDVRDALEALSQHPDTREERRARLAEMAEAMDMFCTGINGKFFNREGEIWPEADITLVDLAMFAREGYEAELSIAYISLINHINSLGEKYQHSFRPIVNITDESHIITVNPLLAKFLVKGSKMWRKLGIWLWLATQNMEDFPKEAEKLLSMIEWWELLNLTNDEIEEVNRFRRLSEAQKLMLLSAKKADKKYTEGVVLATNMEALFRVVPPSIYLALGMTEKHEKAQRRAIMAEHQCSELDAALIMAKQIDKARGIIYEPA
ncbi:conjugative transfer ATPase [Actinobacillus seminis]|uniref:Conjugative transfer ATPase n=1 Tax=Actinobacillus seminis TaxID=722 RepID=A0A263HFI5_9PAST|nr:conjugative transfer ATPase [Actinobacillus seminis]OZN25689.1 conjugative transfer ATPase [Actinobacillus seminis]SUU37041.1 Type IV secretory pathway, VirB4 components [Actinobacillus seminis]